MPSADFHSAHEITLVRGEPTPVSGAQEAATDEHWRAALESNPTLFNGPIASPTSADLSSGMCTVRWHNSNFAHYLHSRTNRSNPCIAPIGTLFVSIAMTTTDGHLVAGKMSPRTAAPGVLQLPGGGVSMRPDQVHLSQHDLTATAVLETSEELGITLDPAELRILGVIRRQCPPDVGVVFTAHPRRWDEIRATFAALRARELQAGVEPEFEELLAISSLADLTRTGLGYQVIDYLPAVAAALLIASAP